MTRDPGAIRMATGPVECAQSSDTAEKCRQPRILPRQPAYIRVRETHAVLRASCTVPPVWTRDLLGALATDHAPVAGLLDRLTADALDHSLSVGRESGWVRGW